MKRPRKDIAIALSQWQRWGLELAQPPQLLSALEHQGQPASPHRSCVLQAGEKHLVLKLLGDNPVYQPGETDIAVAHTLQRRAAQQGLAPQLLFYSASFQYEVHSFIEGTPLATQAVVEDKMLRELCDGIKRYHRATSMRDHAEHAAAFDYAARASAYLQRAEGLLDSKDLQQYERRWSSLRDDCLQLQNDRAKQRVPCHHDLNAGNILLQQEGHAGAQPVFLDWEYAGMGLACMDFASLAVELSLPTALLASTSDIPLHELELATAVYRFLCDIYNAVNHQVTGAPE